MIDHVRTLLINPVMSDPDIEAKIGFIPDKSFKTIQLPDHLSSLLDAVFGIDVSLRAKRVNAVLDLIHAGDLRVYVDFFDRRISIPYTSMRIKRPYDLVNKSNSNYGLINMPIILKEAHKIDINILNYRTSDRLVRKAVFELKSVANTSCEFILSALAKILLLAFSIDNERGVYAS